MWSVARQLTPTVSGRCQANWLKGGCSSGQVRTLTPFARESPSALNWEGMQEIWTTIPSDVPTNGVEMCYVLSKRGASGARPP